MKRLYRIRIFQALSLLLWVATFGCKRDSGDSGLQLDIHSQTKADSLDAYIHHSMAQWEVPGLAIAVVKEDSVVFSRGYGLRHIGRTEAVDTSTIFSLMSPTKTFTTTAIAMLVEEGKLSWDNRVIEHLPYFRLGDAEITSKLTIRDLVSHRSGFKDRHKIWYNHSEKGRKEMVQEMAELRPDAPFRSQFFYNNLMFITAGEVIEAVSGMPWEAFIEERIFKPLDMEKSTSSALGIELVSNRAYPHMPRFFNRFGKLQATEDYVQNIGPAGTIHTNVTDMTRWLRFHLNEGSLEGEHLLKASSLQALQEPHVTLSEEELGPLRHVTDALHYG